MAQNQTEATARQQRIKTRTRKSEWKKPPRIIEPAECIGCDTCMRHCPPEFGAIVNNGLDVVIIPELCSGCPQCIMVCPVDCIYVDNDWQAASEDLWSLVGIDGDPYVAPAVH